MWGEAPARDVLAWGVSTPGAGANAPQPVRIRPASQGDYPLIRRIARVTWAATYRPVIAAHNQRSFLKLAYSDRWLARRHQRPGGRLTVAEVGERVVGYASSVERTAEAAELTSLYVLPECQGRGIGTALLEHELATLVERGMTVVLVSALRENQPARRFYERRGFRAFDERTIPLGDQQIVEVVYGLTLGREG